jgi:hypothetical protein
MNNTDISRRIAQHHALDIKIKAMKDEFDTKIKPFLEVKAKLRALLLQMLNDSGQESAKTDQGTVYKTARQTASLDDPEAFQRHVIGTEAWELADWKANVTACIDFAEMNKHLPPGVKLSTQFDVGVRAPVRKKLSRAERAAEIMATVAEGEAAEAVEEQAEAVEEQAEAA